MKIRLYEPRDAAAISVLYRRSVECIGPQDYSPEQVTAWGMLTPSAERIHARALDGRTTFVAVNDPGDAVGFIDLEVDGHIDLFYCAPEAVGKGVASLLYGALEEAAQARGLRRLYSEASEAARRFFLKRGFIEIARRELNLGGVSIHNFAVEKVLG
jgi:putative acetyltransferase